MFRNALNRTVYLTIINIVMVSCAGERPAAPLEAEPAAREADRFNVPAVREGEPFEVSARVRIDLPRYRVRGACGLYWSGDGFLQLDFDHSSLFGALREEATILVGDGRIAIHDGRRETVVEDGEALAVLADHLDLEVFADDLVYLLLLRPMSLEKGRAVEVERRGADLTVRGVWRGRRVEISGPAGLPPRRIRVVSSGGVGYETRYGYPRGEPGGYPERIVCERMGGGGRISLTVESTGSGGG